MHLRKIVVLGITHKQYDLKKREEFIQNNPLKLIENLFCQGKVKGYVDVSTCLRVEIYLELKEDFSLKELKKQFTNKDIFFKSGKEGVEYLFKVVCGFESVIKGEDQILSQIKKSFETSLKKNRTTGELNVIFNKGIELGKKFRDKSKICHNALSLEAISMKFIKKQVKDLKNKKILLLGVGDLSVAIAKLLKKEGVEDITVTNRTKHKSLEIKEVLDLKMVEFKDKLEAVLESDVVISATSAPHYILKSEEIGKMLKREKHTFLDLAVPRDIDEKLGDLDNVDLYNLDNIWEVHSENLENRDNLLNEYSYLIDEQIEVLNKWYKYKQGERMKKEKIVIGSRGSILALAQSEMVKALLLEKNTNLEIEIKTIVTAGDKDLVSNWDNSNKSLKSFFTKEIEQELLDKKIDIAVHSMKDMPIVSPQGLILGGVPDREDNRDVFISLSGRKLEELPLNSVVGTSSLRRTMALKELRPDLEIKQLRGNIHTRLRKLEEGQYDGIILAAAGLIRVGLKEKITEFLEHEKMMPAPAQGALYIQCREEDFEIEKLLKTIHNPKVEKIVKIEREFSKIFDGGCHTPMGCNGEIIENKILLKGIYCKDGKVYKSEILRDEKEDLNIARELAEIIKNQIEESENGVKYE